ncbi:MAG: endopeptidase La, partial [Pleurocapsa sp. SU_196_0]|nr:endopeptidase La [Pleurocapsa sp. SU_196_0]
MRWELPVLALRNMVIAPGHAQSIAVGRAKSRRSVEEAQAADRRVLLVTQRDQNNDDPTGADLFEIGTLAAVKQVVRMPDQTLEVLVEPMERVQIVAYLPLPYLRAIAETVESTADADSNTLRVLVDEAKSAFDKYVGQNKNLRLDNIHLEHLRQLSDASQVADTISFHAGWEVAEKEDLLETLSIRVRLEKVIKFLNRDLERFDMDKKIAARVKEQMDQNQREYYLREQMKAIGKELGGGEDSVAEVDDLRQKIEAAGMPEKVKEKALKEVARLERTPGGSPETTVVRNYIDWLLDVPWTKRDDEILDIKRTRDILDDDHHGLDEVKERILEFLAVRQLTQDMRQNVAQAAEKNAQDKPEDLELRAPILCLVGPPGVGKTSLGKSVARALNRQFVRMSLGGVRDEAEIRGHRRTYIGSMPGRIIQSMKQAGVVNPIILLDEIDKMASDWRGDPASAMLEVLDPEQNHTFQDHYLEVQYDLSQVMFITTANSLSTIPRPLLDRMEVIEIPGYTLEEKLAIAKGFRLPRQIKSHGLNDKLEISDEALKRVIQEYTKESGVRNLDRQIQKLTRKAARELLEKPWDGKKIIAGEEVEDYLGVPLFEVESKEKQSQVGVSQGMYYTPVGGGILLIETLATPGTGKVNFTGSLGDVMKESVQAALAYLRAHATEYGADPEFYKNLDIHVHFPSGATPKDGPSAGIAIATSVISAITKRPARADFAMTGEISLRGKVLIIGGVKEKLLGAYQAGIRKVILPKGDAPFLKDVPENIKKDMEIHLVEDVREVLEMMLEPKLETDSTTTPAPATQEVVAGRRYATASQLPTPAV